MIIQPLGGLINERYGVREDRTRFDISEPL